MAGIKLGLQSATNMKLPTSLQTLSLTQNPSGQVVKRPDASMMNSKLRNLLNEYQEKLDAIKNKEIYTCAQIKNMISKSQSEDTSATFQQICILCFFS